MKPIDHAPKPPSRGSTASEVKVTLRLRLSAHDAHYGGGLVDGARVLGLFGDVATELLIRHDGDEGLFRAYDTVAPAMVASWVPWAVGCGAAGWPVRSSRR